MIGPTAIITTATAVVKQLLAIVSRNALVNSIASHRAVQTLVYRLVYEVEDLQGIGAGAGVGTSGESEVADLIDAEAPVVFDGGAYE